MLAMLQRKIADSDFAPNKHFGARVGNEILPCDASLAVGSRLGNECRVH